MWFKKASKYRPEKEDRGLINNVTNRSDCPELRAGFKKYFPPYIFQRNNSSHTLTPSNLLVPRKNGQYIVSPKGECWKWAIDGETQRRYFYNKYTREVTWNKPSSLNEWKRFLDTTTNAFYYYSIITRETTWDKPEAFVETRIGTNSVRNDCEGDAQRNSKLETKKPSTISVQSGFKKSSTYSITSPNDCIGRDDHILRNDKYEELEEREPAEISHSNAKYLVKKLEEDNHPWTPLFDYSSGTYFFHNLDTEAISETKPDEFQEWLSVQSSSKSETYFYNILTGVSTWKIPTSFQQNNKGNNGITRREGKREKLVKLISKYYHGECSYDEKLLHKFEGREHIAIQAIESILEEGETPFDERLLAVSAYVESAVTSMGPEPYDENIDRWRRSVVTPVNKGTSSIQTNHENFAIVKPPNKSPPFDSTTNHISSTSAHSRYLSKPVHLSGSSGRTVLFLYR